MFTSRGCDNNCGKESDGVEGWTDGRCCHDLSVILSGITLERGIALRHRGGG